jgi:hypothetical protein
MSPLAHVFSTAALVAAGVATYHVVVAPDRAPAAGSAGLVAERDVQGLEDRLAALEGAGRPLLQGSTPAQDIADRLAVLERRLAALEGGRKAVVTAVGDRGDATPSDAGAAAPEARPVEGAPALAAGGDGTSPLTKAEEDRVRELVGAMVRNRFDQANDGRMRRTLERLGIQLDDAQQKQLDDALAKHRETVRDTFRAAREAGKEREEIRAEINAQNAKLTETLATFMHPADAQALTEALTQRPDGGGGPGAFGGRAGGGGRGGAR